MAKKKGEAEEMVKEVFEDAETMPAVYAEGGLPAISDEILDELIETAKDVTLWVKPRGNSFVLDDASLPNIVGNLVAIKPYLVKWTDNVPDKIEYAVNELDWPEGYEPRCDIVIQTEGGDKIGVSLAKTSFKKFLCPYIKMLSDQGLKPEQVRTQLTTWEAKSNLGSFNLVKATMVSDVPF
jgi:hypothetical protein